MRRIGLTSIVILALTAGAARAASIADVKSNGYIRGASANEVPYSYMDENGTAKGIGPDVAVAVLKSMGVNEIDWTVTPFGSLIPGLKARRYDFVARGNEHFTGSLQAGGLYRAELQLWRRPAGSEGQPKESSFL